MRGVVPGRVGQVEVAVVGADGGARQLEGGHADTGLGALRQVGAHQVRGRRHRRQVTARAPAGPGPPGTGIDTAGGRGSPALQGHRDAVDVGLGQTDGQGRGPGIVGMAQYPRSR